MVIYSTSLYILYIISQKIESILSKCKIFLGCLLSVTLMVKSNSKITIPTRLSNLRPAIARVINMLSRYSKMAVPYAIKPLTVSPSRKLHNYLPYLEKSARYVEKVDYIV